LTLFQRIFERFPDHHVNAVIFSENGKPRIKDVLVFALYCRRTNTVIFNLARHVDNAARIALDLNPSFSIRGLFWYSMLASLLHELHHSILLQDCRYHGEDARVMVEVEADRWRDQTLRMLATEMDLEPPPLTEEPFLQEHFNALLQQQERRGNAGWVKHQKLLVGANVLYWDAETHIAYPNMAALCGSQTTEREQGAMDQEAARVYGAQQEQKMAAFTKNEEEKERLLRRAIAMSRKVIVDYVDRYGKSSSGRVLFPFDLNYRAGYWYLGAYCTDRSGKRLFRLDRIKAVSF
jgi:hypothetical protein